MPLLFLVTLVIVGVLWYVAETYLPMPAPMRVIVRVVFLVLTILFVARFFGLV